MEGFYNVVSVKQIAVFLFSEDIVFGYFYCKMLIKDFWFLLLILVIQIEAKKIILIYKLK